ncbi:hypothetical protein OTU49_000290 [Cherax quadricarinatus]|uniref:Uncharacterized protein n=1 Tax=Cherax quadricarinatus TaxID=27406 RepID=A0AAW0Y2I0_CHEQU
MFSPDTSPYTFQDHHSTQDARPNVHMSHPNIPEPSQLCTSPSLSTPHAFPIRYMPFCVSSSLHMPPCASPEHFTSLSASSERSTSLSASSERSTSLCASSEHSTSYSESSLPIPPYVSPEPLTSHCSPLHQWTSSETGTTFLLEEGRHNTCSSDLDVGEGWNVGIGDTSDDDVNYRARCGFSGRPVTRQRSHTYCGLELARPHAHTSGVGGRCGNSDESWWHAEARRGSQCSSSSFDLAEESVNVALDSLERRRSLSQDLPGGDTDNSKDSRGCSGLRRALSSFSLRILQGEKVRPAQQRILRPPRRRQTIRGLSGLTIDSANQWTSTAPTDG